MNILSKEALEGLIYDLKESGKMVGYNYVTKTQRIVYRKPRGFFAKRNGKFCDITSEIMDYFEFLLNNYEKYKVDEKFQKKVYKNLERLRLKHYTSFKQLKGFIVEDDKFIDKLLKEAPGNIFEMENPSKEFMEKAFNINNNVVLYDFVGDKALYPKELKIEVLHRHPGFTSKINRSTNPLLEVEAYKMDCLASFKDEDKLYKNIDVIRNMEEKLEETSNIDDVYCYFIKKDGSDDDIFSKDEIIEKCDKYNIPKEKPAATFLIGLNDDEYEDLMKYLKLRYKFVVKRLMESARWNYNSYIFM